MKVSEPSGNMTEKEIARGSVPVLNISITDWVENAFDPDSKELLQNKHFYELATAQWDSLGRESKNCSEE